MSSSIWSSARSRDHANAYVDTGSSRNGFAVVIAARADVSGERPRYEICSVMSAIVAARRFNGMSMQRVLRPNCLWHPIHQYGLAGSASAK